jgi:hypothetical protein
MFRYSVIAALALLGGCATLTESNQQQVLVQTIQDNREVFGAGCLLSNDVGKWFVTSPGRVMIRKSRMPLRVDCKMEGTGAANENIASKVNSTLWGNVAFTAGVGYFVDLETGAGFDYPPTLTIVLQKASPASTEPQSAPAASPVY